MSIKGALYPEQGVHVIDCLDYEHDLSYDAPCPDLKIAAFDLDHTLIRPLSKKKFTDHSDADDWELMPNVQNKLKKLVDYKIVVFTNQASPKFNIEVFEKKIKNIVNKLEVKLLVYACTDHGYCRKPSIGMWEMMRKKFKNLKISDCFYVGDAAGRKKDFSDSDVKFAKNIGITFYEPEDFFKSDNFPVSKEYNIIHPLQTIKESNYINPILHPLETQEMIILCGPPGAGKTTWSSLFSKKYTIICQDELGTMKNVNTAIEKAINKGQSLIIDKLNNESEKRCKFIEVAKKYNLNVRIVWFDISKEVSKHLCTYREIITGKHIPSIVLNKYYSKPIVFDETEKNILYRMEFKIDNELINREIFYSYLT